MGVPVAELDPVTSVRPTGDLVSLRRLLAESPVDADWADDLRRMQDEAYAAGKTRGVPDRTF